ncbi:hypothetical protein K1T73_17565 [Roseovarius sp. SCSIO 43702]|uniref:DUF6731 family protein n=1 Tax=Roseovarius sp. SCSIO 43702 TaxID=2823043 RepID=UPI001C72C498|nr:DUF6731 family protein [Roseovarius sp. SCSIO 43702]QYX56812.1 hypothetical protein K1T73_17565 [Roseovarius sp. SCSIO 43702]
MDAKIKARFYQVENVGKEDATLFDCLHQLWAHANRTAYETIYGDVRVRIENFANDPAVVGDGFIDGEFVRQQTDNIPPFAEQGQPLEGNVRPLGHRCAFRYHAQLNVLLLESRREAVTPIRMDALVKARLNPHRGFFLSPVLSQAALEKLRNGTPRRVTFRVARPAEMEVVEGEDLGLEENLARLQNHFEGPNIEVTASWPRGNRDGILSQNAIARTIRWATGNRDHVEKLQVKINEEPDAIDIFSEQMKVVDVLDLDSHNVDRNYATRRAFLAQSFNDHLPILRRLYGA